MSLLREALSLADASGERISVIECLEQLAEVMLQSDDPAAAAVLFGFAEAQRAALEAPPGDFQGAFRETMAAQGPNDVEWLPAWNSGRRMSFPQAIEYALRTSSQVPGAR